VPVVRVIIAGLNVFSHGVHGRDTGRN
jgi:hypothetical protein